MSNSYGYPCTIIQAVILGLYLDIVEALYDSPIWPNKDKKRLKLKLFADHKLISQ
jgi:hypothetical protein